MAEKGSGAPVGVAPYAPRVHLSRLCRGLWAQCQLGWEGKSREGACGVGLAQEGTLLPRVAGLPGPWEPSKWGAEPSVGWIHGGTHDWGIWIQTWTQVDAA